MHLFPGGSGQHGRPRKSSAGPVAGWRRVLAFAQQYKKTGGGGRSHFMGDGAINQGNAQRSAQPSGEPLQTSPVVWIVENKRRQRWETQVRTIERRKRSVRTRVRLCDAAPLRLMGTTVDTVIREFGEAADRAPPRPAKARAISFANTFPVPRAFDVGSLEVSHEGKNRKPPSWRDPINLVLVRE